ncbi:MAG TPA: lysine--tRNA ligase [Candidatus Saccharimonadales bacterium]
MSGEETLMQIRKDKHQELNGGTYPLSLPLDDDESLRWSISHYLGQMIRYENSGILPTTIILSEVRIDDDYMVHGRLTAVRKSGGITFLKVTDATGSIQLVATKNNLADYDKLRLLDLGDIVEVVGKPVLTKTGEKSVLIAEWKVLTKSHRAPPEKFAGITDPELKARKRYLDLMSSEETRARFMTRSCILRGIRDYMETNLFLEVETSTLNNVASGANAKPFITHHNALDTDMRLRIAPELYLKRLLVGGLDRVFEIGRVYRNEGIDTKHNPEFTCMESYQAYGRFPELITMTKDLLTHVDKYCRARVPQVALASYQKWIEARPFTLDSFVEITMSEAVSNAASNLGIMLRRSGVIDDVDPNGDHPRRASINWTDFNMALKECNTVGQQIAVDFEYLVEPFLTEDYRTEDGSKSLPVFITEYPKDISPLARDNGKNPGFEPRFVDRFELFIEGRELANAFQELNDPDEQARRFKEQLDTNAKDAADYDADYIEALEYGLPPCIGLGLGIDRLCQLMTNSNNIKDVILFPTLRPEK